MSNLFKGAALFIGGALAGAAAVLLLSPETRDEVRKQVSECAREAQARMQQYAEKLKQDLAEANSAAETAKNEPKEEEA